MVKTLDMLRPGESAAVVSLLSAGSERRRALDLGFVPGTRVCALHVSPWGDPVAYGVCGAVIALRRADARRIVIETEKK